MLKTVETNPPIAHKSNPQCRGAHQVGRKPRETLLGLSPPVASNSHRFLIGSDNIMVDAYY